MKNPPVNTLTYCTVLAHATHKALDELANGDCTKKQLVFMMFLQAFAGHEQQNARARVIPIDDLHAAARKLALEGRLQGGQLRIDPLRGRAVQSIDAHADEPALGRIEHEGRG